MRDQDGYVEGAGDAGTTEMREAPGTASGEPGDAHETRLVQAGQLLAEVVHEIKNPLAVIQGYAQLLHDNCEEGENRRDLQCIIDETRRVSALVDDMLAFTRRTPDTAEDVDMGHVITASINLSRHGMRNARVSVVASVPDGPVMVRGHHGAYMQVLMNLLANARHSLETGRAGGRGISLRIEDDGGSHVGLIVANNGPPIPAEVAASIFDPFFTTKSRDEGNGLGLSVCRDILDRFGGSIRLEPGSDAGGVAFRLELPRARTAS